MKRTLSILLCLIICIAMFPGQAFAAGNLSAPGKITAKVTADKNVTVSWSKVSSAKGYKVYRAESREGEDYRYTSYKCIKTVGSKATVKYKDKTVKPGKKYYYKVKAYKVVNGKKKYSKYTKVKTAYVKPESWTAERLEKDIISYLTDKGYTVKKEDLGDEYHQTVRPDSGGKYSTDYSKVLKEAKKDVLKEVKDIEAYYKENATGYSLVILIDVVDSVNPYGISLNGADIYVNEDTAAKFPDLDEATKEKYVKRVFELVNQERKKAGVAPLVLNEKLCDMAVFKLNEMDELGYFGHTSPVYGSPSQMAKALGITDMGCGENLAGSLTPDDAMEAWMSSEGHRANILNPKYTQIGIACHINSDTNSLWWVQEFIY